MLLRIRKDVIWHQTPNQGFRMVYASPRLFNPFIGVINQFCVSQNVKSNSYWTILKFRQRFMLYFKMQDSIMHRKEKQLRELKGLT